jgi:hypothetical protein
MAESATHQVNERIVKKAKWALDEGLMVNINMPNLVFNEKAQLIERNMMVVHSIYMFHQQRHLIFKSKE